jgi:enamine deaminase RidA (YjgF/YER057c/UK114 family)
MAADINIYNVEPLGAPLGQYSHISRVKASEYLFLAGTLSADKDGNVIGVRDFQAQCTQVFANIETALKSADAGFADIVSFTTYMVHSQYIPEFMEFRLREFSKMFPSGTYPPNTLLMVDRLVNEEFLVEVQATAAI